MTKRTKLYSAISYITWIGWIIAFILYDKSDRLTRHHLNQALAINLIGVLASVGSRLHGVIYIAAWILGLIVCILSIMGIIRALRLSDEPLPIVGNFKIL